jgi:glycosyltransferase involved in cell wall biosynthesis
MPFRIAVFAHNEESSIAAALRAILDETAGSDDVRIHVLVNGSTDRTPQIVRALADAHPQIVPVEIPLGDKCNAWNMYVDHFADDKFCHFFMDGDVRCAPGSLARMHDVLAGDEQATAIAGWPLSGRNREAYRKLITERGWLFGNLYAVKSSHLSRLRDLNIRLPVGLFGNDHVITRFMQSRLDRLPAELPRVAANSTEAEKAQVIYDPRAGYTFDSLNPLRPRDWRLYWRRQVRYRWRRHQLVKLRPLRVDELPRTMDGVNKQVLAELAAAGPWRLGPLDRAVLRRLRRMYPTPESVHYERLVEPQRPTARLTERAAL